MHLKLFIVSPFDFLENELKKGEKDQSKIIRVNQLTM